MSRKPDDQAGPDPHFSPDDLARQGAELLRKGNLSAALPMLQRALAMQKAQGDPHGIVDTANALGVCYLMLRLWREAESHYTEALQLGQEKLGATHPLVAKVLENLATLKHLSDQFDLAQGYLEQAITIYRGQSAEPNTARQLANALHTLGERYGQRQKLVDAEAAWRESLDVLVAGGLRDTPEMERMGDLLFSLYLHQNQLLKATGVMREVLVPGARQLWQQLVRRTQLGRDQLLRNHRSQVDTLLSNLLLRWPQGSHAAQTALDVLLWRRGFGLELYRCANRASRKDPALKARLDELKSMRAALAAAMFQLPPDPKRAHSTQIHWEGIGRSPEVDALEVEIFSGLSEEDCYSIFDAPDCATIAFRLPQDAALVEFWRCRQADESGTITPRYLALVLRPGASPQISLLNLCAADVIEDGLLLNFLAALTGESVDRELPRSAARHMGEAQDEPLPDSLSWRNLGAQLRELVFDPLLPMLEGAKQLFIVPDGLLARLPFAVLPVGTDRFVIDTHIISYLGSGREICAECSSATRPGPPVVIAAPDYNWSEGALNHPAEDQTLRFSDLPGARAEGEQVAARLGVLAILGSAATERRVKETHSPVILHISTHGLMLPAKPVVVEVDMLTLQDVKVELRGTVQFPEGFGRLSGRSIDDQALRSMLVFAGINTWLNNGELPEEAEDGWLNAEDIALMDLDGNELTVLSACETALGSLQIGEGVLGLRSAFHVAGAKTLLLSLWRVQDEITRELMAGFYDYLLDEHAGRAEALQLAQLDLRRRYPDQPTYWGAFICQGAPGRLPP
jgi:CHAT domain-containing protein